MSAAPDFEGDSYRACLHGNATSQQQRSAASQIILLNAAKAELIAALKEADEDLATEGFDEAGAYRAPIRSIIAKHMEMLCDHRDALLVERRELLGLLIEALDISDDDNNFTTGKDWAERARAAIAKAGGAK